MRTMTWTHPPLLRMRDFLRAFNHFHHPWEAFARRGERATADLEEELAPFIPPEAALPTVGQSLRQARQASGRDLGQVSAALRIRQDYLRAIEAGEYTELPAPAYAIGFIRSYAAYLGLDGDGLVRRFKRETEGRHLAPDLEMPHPASEHKVPRGLVMGLVIVALCGYGIWHYRSSEDQGRAERVAAVPSALMTPPNELAPMPTVVGAQADSQVKALSALSPAAGQARASDAGPLEAKASLAPATATSAAATAKASLSSPEPMALSEPVHIYGVSGDAPYRIALRAAGETWLEVKDGETSIFRRLMQAGDEYRLPEKPGIVMRIGNAKEIEVLVDGKPLPASAQPSQGHRTVVSVEARELLARAGTR
jgi:cytoskeleton protein RodZ